MRLEGKKTQIDYFPMKNKVIAENEKHYIKYGIETTTGSIYIGLFVHHTPKGRIKQIKKPLNRICKT